MKHFGRRASISVVVCLATVLALSGCGASQPPAEKASDTSSAPAAAPSALPVAQILPPRSGAATTCAPLLGHAAYAAQSCEACHPCGAKATSGHPAAWSDRTSAGFHAYSANGGLSNCQGCHGVALDGVGGTATTSCAQCHGATWKTNCVMCHGGTDNQTGAPAKTTWGNTADAVRVGTHTAHVAATHGLAAAVACATCHVQPVDALAAGHVDGGTSEVVFSGRAIQGVVTATAWTRATATCSNTYCHGATLQGGTATAPVWTRTDGTQRACNSCHGAPPPPPHSTSTGCATCHGAGYSATTVNVATHMNGVLDVSGMTCTSCHGTAGRAATALNPQLPAAPPVQVSGHPASAVGAHQAHLVNTRLRSAAIACTECHVVPSSTSHSTGVVDMTWGTLARSAAVVPTWTGATCTNYCHGATLVGGTAKAPTWIGDATQAACTSCHGLAPANAYHTRTDLACGACHTGYTATTVNAANHINATLDYTVGCTTCHGNSAQTASQAAPLFAAPPTDARGNTAVTSRGVGTHQIHLVNGTLRNALACSECHTVPSSQLHANGTVEVVWGTLARTGAVNPAWNGTGCSASYCHGNFRNGNTTYVPTWTVVAANKCGTCHGTTANPAPGGTHPGVAATSCGTCHTGYTGTTVNLTNHMNGVLDVSGMTCTSCHGTSTRAATTLNPQLPASPPVGTKGETLATTRAVGAHQAHLVNTRLRSTSIACSECHVVPSSTSHSTGVVNMTWGTLTRTGGVVPTWTGTTCTNYCHGANLTGGTATAPTWTGTATQAACNSCHGAPPPAPHSTSTACSSCHTGYTATTVNPATHMNGVKDATGMTCTSCHGTSTRAATTLNPQLAAAPPVDTAGNTATTARGVGAHMKHLSTATRSSNFACTECHTVPTATNHANGTKDLVFGTLAKTGGKVPAYNATTLGCSATYCHGNFTGGKTTAVPLWTGAAMACNACHNMPNTSTGRHSTHMSRSGMNCSTCHNGVATGTGNPSTNSAIVGPTLHVNGVNNVVFGGTYSGRAVTATFNATTHGCSSISCHGNETW